MLLFSTALRGGEKLKDADRLIADDKKYIWHPFTQMADWEKEDALLIRKGEGAWLVDVHGNRYLDGVSSLWVNIHGHCRPEIDKAITGQLGKIAHSTLLGLSNIPSIRLARALVEIAPEGLAKVFYSDDGSTAMEIALKMAFQYWRLKDTETKRKRFVGFGEAYHGDTIGAISLGGIDLFHRIFRPLLFEKETLPPPYCYRCPYGKEKTECEMECLAALETVLRGSPGEIIAVVLEPLVQGAAGILVQPDGFARGVHDLCRKYETLFIADEVATGFGRTGAMFACVREGITPDLMALAKGITGGYLPIAATLATDEIYRVFLGDYAEKRTFFHGHSYTGNPLGCAAALASLEVFEKDNVMEMLHSKIVRLKALLQSFLGLEHVGEVRQCGFMVGVELVRDRITKQPYEWAEKIGNRVIREARRRGVVIRPLGNVIVLMPPLCVTDEELQLLTSVVYESIKMVTES